MKIIHIYIIILLILTVYVYFNRYEVFIDSQSRSKHGYSPSTLIRYNKLNGNVEYRLFMRKEGWEDFYKEIVK